MSMPVRGGRHARDVEPVDLRPTLLVTVVSAVQFALAWLAASSVRLAMAVMVGAFAVVAVFIWPSVILVAAFPASFITQRVGPASVDMSVADVLTFLGVVAALPSVPWAARAFRQVLFATLGYSAIVAISVVAHPSLSAAVEVGHRFVMVVGTVCIGAAVVHRGKVTPALRALIVAAGVVSVAAIVDTLTDDLRPAYAFGLHKNTIGTLLVGSIICVYLGRTYLRWPTWLMVGSGLLMAGGLAASQSRGSGLALGVAALLYLIRTMWNQQGRRLVRILPLVVLLAASIGTAMVLSFQKQADERVGSDYQHSSVGSRTTTYERVWHEVIVPNPVLGAAPKWFGDPALPAAPHNLVISELSEDGFVGFAALIGVLWVLLRMANRAPPLLGQLAWYVLVARVVASGFDIFWVAGPNTLPFLVVGLAVGVSAAAEHPRSGDQALVVSAA